MSCCQEPQEGNKLIENEGEKQDNIEKEVDEIEKKVKDETKKRSKPATGSLEYLVDVTVAYPKGKPMFLPPFTQP